MEKKTEKKQLKEAELRVVQFELNDVIVASGSCKTDTCNPYTCDSFCAAHYDCPPWG